MSQTRFINPTTLGKPPGYTHVVEVTAPARIVYIAGQLGIDKEGKLSSDFRQQAVQTFEIIKRAKLILAKLARSLRRLLMARLASH